jgi:hypothetical protein
VGLFYFNERGTAVCEERTSRQGARIAADEDQWKTREGRIGFSANFV